LACPRRILRLPDVAVASEASDLTHDRGYTAFARINHGNFYLEPGYVHSIKLNDDAATLTVGVDLWAFPAGRH
jgi:acetoacetate decarboxylase